MAKRPVRRTKGRASTSRATAPKARPAKAGRTKAATTKTRARKARSRKGGAGKPAARPATATRAPRKPGAAPARGRRRRTGQEEGGLTRLSEALQEHHETSPVLTGGDLDADWQRADTVGEEAVGGSVATPDQDVVDEIGHALGVEQESDAEVRASDDILRERDAQYWELEREAADEEEGRRRPRR